MMKKLICAVLALTLLLAAGVPTAFAHGGGHRNCTKNDWCYQDGSCIKGTRCSSGGSCVNHCRFADEDEDGICDNCQSQCLNCQEGKDEDGNGVCDSCGVCSHYLDEDQDGICDRHVQREQAETQTTRQPACYQRSASHHSTSRHSGGHHRGRHH